MRARQARARFSARRLTLFALAKDSVRHGKKLALVGEGGQVATEIVGL